MNKFRFSLYMLVAVAVFSLGACMKKDYDRPPDTSGYDPMLQVTHSIAQLKALNPPPGGAITIDSDIVIYGIVVADDRSGNFYKQIVVEDSTGGMTVLIDGNNLYNEFPIGRKVYIRCKGLVLFHYNGTPQLGNALDNTGALSGIPSSSVANVVVKANYPNAIIPAPVTLQQLTQNSNQYLNRLIAISNAEFEQISSKYAVSSDISSGTSLNIRICSGGNIELRTSGYASFQPYYVPRGNGTITAIYTVFGSKNQLVIRDTSDVKFYNKRCDGSTPTEVTVISISDLRKKYVNQAVKLGSYKIRGVVISDAFNKNINSGNLVIQDASGRGIRAYIGGSITYKTGDMVEMDITGDSLKLYAGVLEVEGTPAQVQKVGTGTIEPLKTTINNLLAKYSDFESTLVTIDNANIQGGGTYNGSKNINDGSGTMVMYTANGALFAGSNVPLTPKSITGIVSQFNGTRQLQIRNLNDVK